MTPHRTRTAATRAGRRHPRRAVLLALAGLLLLGAPAGSALADEAIGDETSVGPVTFGIAPSGPQGPTSRTAFEYFLAPGTSFTDYVGVTNFSEQDLQLEVYPADAAQTPAGDFTLATADVPATDVGSWVRIDPRTYTVPARTRLDIPFLLTVPDDAAPGDHAGGVVASLSTGEGTVQVENRVGVRLHAQVAGELDPGLVVRDLRTSYASSWVPFSPGTLTVEYTVHNEGNVRLAADQSVTATGLLGITAAQPAVDPVPELLPGSSLDVRVVITGVAPLFRLTTDVALDPIARPELDLDTSATETASAAVWAVPWTSIAAVVLVAVLVWLLVRWTGGRAQRRAVALERALAKAREEGRAEARGSDTAPEESTDAAASEVGTPTRRSAREATGRPGVGSGPSADGGARPGAPSDTGGTAG